MASSIAIRVPAVLFARMNPWRPLAAKLQQLVDRIDPQAGRYRMLFESSPLPMWVLDDESLRFLAVNDAALGLYGYSREEFLGMSAADLRRPGERRDIDGVGHLVDWRGRRARLVVINDITERLRTQQALEHVNHELELSHERLRAL